MNFKTAFKHSSPEEVLGLLRIGNGFSLLIYQFWILLPNWSDFFSKTGFVSPDKFSLYPASWIFTFWEMDLVKAGLFILMLLLTLFYTCGVFAKLSLIVLIPLVIGFHLANPMIIHEPQQLTNLLMVILFFLPIEDAFVLRRGKDPWKKLPAAKLQIILMSMILFLGFYYLLAGLKKLPDMNWVRGEAVGMIAGWPYLGRNHYFAAVLQNPVVNFCVTWGALVFELSFLPLMFTRWRYMLLVVGFIFHFALAMFLDVGLFFWAMLQWYPLLLITPLRKSDR